MPESDIAGARLVHSCDDAPGIRRKRVGKGFAYYDPAGARITDAQVIDRIRRLAIPPAYTDVWICVNPRGHLQATGRDARRRKQYRYHVNWRVLRDRDKFERLAEFGALLPRLRRRLRADLGLPGFPRDKVLAMVVTLLGDTMGRIGNEEYARTNGSYGLTTLRVRHLAFPRGEQPRLRFRGKGGRMHELAVGDARLARLLRRCQQLPGQALFQYVDDAGEIQPIDSGMVNDYLQQAMDKDFSAKDFRTWGATTLAAAGLARVEVPRSERARTSVISEVIRNVADVLGNTPAICRKSYIDPGVFDAWIDGRIARVVDRYGIRATRGSVEKLMLRLLRLRSATRSTAKRKSTGDSSRPRMQRARRSAPPARKKA